MSGGHGTGHGGSIRKMVIVLLLVGGIIVLNRFAVRTAGFDPSALLALGFVVLTSYAFGQLLGSFGLPHLTGYILAGLALGPSGAHYLPAPMQVPPFDRGVLSESVIQQLHVFESLAVVLIAVTAGGELRLAMLRRGLRSISGMIGGHLAVVGPLAFGFIAAISGLVAAVRMPGLPDLETAEILAMSVVVGAVVIATSPAATVAIVTETRAKGPLTSVVLASVVMMDVVIVVIFSVASTVAAQMLGLSVSGEVGLYLLQHIGGSVVAGVAVGVGMILYLRFVKAELLLFLLGTIFTVVFLANALSLEPVLLFIAAGFIISNFSSEGEHLLQTVERLFLPVSVVFFTLAGAHLRLDILIGLAPFAVTMVAIRGVGIFAGTKLGLRIAGAEPIVRRLGWVGFVPQAGVAIALAALVGRNFGELGATFQTLLVAGIAINELVGPVMLKLGLARAGEIAKADVDDEPAPSASSSPGVEEPAPLPAPRGESGDAWGPPLSTGSAELDGTLLGLTRELDDLVREVSEDPLARFRESGLAYIRELRREFLRHHRRITIQALTPNAELSPSEAVRLEQAELAEKWRAIVLARAADVLKQPTWDPNPMLDAAEAIVDRLPDVVRAAYPDESFAPHESDSFFITLARSWLRMRRGARRIIRRPMRPRAFDLRALSRWHFWGLLPDRLEPVAAVHAQAEARLVARTRNIFDGLVRAYEALATDIEAARRAADDARARVKDPAATDGVKGESPPDGAAAPAEAHEETEFTPEEIDERLRGVRRHIEQELMMAVQALDRIVGEATRRTREALGASLRGLKEDALRAGTPDLPARRRAASTLYKRRDDALRQLERGVAAARDTSAALYNRLALELELLALEGRVKEALEQHATTLGRDVRGRAHRQVTRVQEAIASASAQFGELVASDKGGGELSREIRNACDPVVRVAGEAARVGAALRDQLADERAVTQVLDALTRAAQGLTDRYRIPAGPVPETEDRLPPPLGTVDVPFREWVLARIETTLAPRLLASTREVAARVEPLAQALTELERRVAFNVELATSELSVIEDEVPLPETRKLLRDMIGGALERNRELFAGYGETSEQWGEEIRRAVHDAVLTGLVELRSGIVEGEIGRLRYQLVREVRGRRILRFFKDLQRSIARSWTIASRALREGMGEARIDRMRTRLGLPVRLAEEDIGERTFAPPTPAPSIPMVYRRLFSAQALEAGDILTGRDEALGRALSVLEGREGAALRAVALVGPDGVGKSALVNAIIRARRWPKVRELSLDAPATMADVDALFDPATEGHLVVISGLHWLRALEPGGLAPLRRFLAGVIADRGKNAYLVRADSLVWAQCTQVAALTEAFTEVVRLDPLDPVGLSAAVLARHTVSGFGLVFSQGVTPESRLEEAVLQATAPLSRPQESFFRALHAASGGLLRDALRLWLAAVDHVDEGADFVHLGPVPTPVIYALRHLDEQRVLTLYQVARQGWMSPRVLASLYRIDETAAEAQLSALAHLGVLERKGSIWRIAVHLRGSIDRLLRERRFVA